ncbi:MAG: hypothetical protein COT00_04465 [Candidatus Omnitrophica bacterium CG07_land_8_20_14_0_80_50_8]|nr:MAG: hypothetical protein COT00_04465 [Candidatus Omnitrophica bacterium CG07_land_8_20_14_0_80_50_8]
METQLASIAQRLSKLLLSARLGFIAKNGLKVVIAGRPNVGKSSLMNCLARTDRVIVTPYAGTTRDTVETQIQIQGFPVSIVDTAGIQETSHPIEIEGIKRTKAAVFESDVVLYVMDASQEGHPDDDALLRDLGDKPKIIVLNKCDLPQNVNERRIRLQNKNAAIFNTSCITHEGIEWLENEIVGFITHGKAQSSEEVVVSSVRQKHLLEKAFQNVTDATNGARSQLSPELLAVDVRLALDQLGALVGEVVTDDILEALFSQFCVGK